MFHLLHTYTTATAHLLHTYVSPTGEYTENLFIKKNLDTGMPNIRFITVTILLR